MRVTLGGAEVDLLGRDELLESVLRRLQDGGAPLYLASANLDHIYHFGIDSGREGFFDRPGGPDWLVLLDGRPTVAAAHRLTGREWELLAGADLLPDLLRTAARARARVGFLGGTERQHRLLASQLSSDFPTLDVGGYWAPDRGTLEDVESSKDLAATIAGAGVELLIVGLGKPRQEEWLERHGPRTGARVAAAFGAAADFVAGTAVRAPDRWRDAGMEWAYRLTREPRRLARRYLVQGPASLYRLRRRSWSAGDIEGAGPAPVSSPSGWQRRLGRVLAVGDAIAIASASGLAYLFRFTLGELGVVQGLDNELPIALAAIPMWLALLAGFGCYRPAYLNAGGEAVRRFMTATAAGVLSLGFASFALNLSLARGYVLLLSFFVLILGGSNRVFVREYLRRRRAAGRFQQNVLVVGTDDEAREVAAAMTSGEVAGYRTVGFLDEEGDVGEHVIPGVPILGRPEDVLDVAYDHRVGLVVVSPTSVRPGTLGNLTVLLEGSQVDVAVAPSLFQVVSRRVTVESVGNVPILHVNQIRLSPSKVVAKRIFDLIFASAIGLLTTPVWLAAAIVLLLREGRPLLFTQERVGRDGEPFTMFKFRTMVRDAEARLEDLRDGNEAGHIFFKIRRDPRVHRTGRFLRKWSIDELPQLLNVMRGDISMVGPRPALPSEVEKYEPWQHRRLRVKPGITGVWQTSGRSAVGFDEAVRMDLFYIENWSLGYDLFLLGKTVFAVLGRSGAY